jgi:hypothetical protein
MKRLANEELFILLGITEEKQKKKNYLFLLESSGSSS